MDKKEMLRKKEERAKMYDYNAAKLALFKSQFVKDEHEDESDDIAVEYYIPLKDQPDPNANPYRNVYLKRPLNPINDATKQGYSDEVLTAYEKEMADALYQPLPEHLRKKLGVTIKGGKRIRTKRRRRYVGKRTRKDRGKKKRGRKY